MGTTLWRALVLVAALQLCTMTASAQTVITTNAPPGTTVEFVLNGATVGSAQTDASGSVTLTAKTGAIAADMDARIGALVLECTNLAPYSRDIGRLTGLPVFDVVTLVHWFHRSLAPERFVQD